MLPRRRRVTKRADWQRIQRRDARVHSNALVLSAGKGRSPISRFGFVVGIRVDKKATRRNLLKRRLRYFAAQQLPHLKEGYDITVIAKPAAGSYTYRQLGTVLKGLLQKARLFKG